MGEKTSEKQINEESPLARLIKPAVNIDEELYEALKDVVAAIDPNTLTIAFTDKYDCLDAEGKIIVTLATYYAMYRLKLIPDPYIHLKKISEVSGVNYNTVRPRLSKAGKISKFVKKSEKPGYYTIREVLVREIKKFIKQQLERCKQ